MKDLDDRGAGDLLGAEQSGFINDIGFETYHKILEEAVRELKDEHFKELLRGPPAARGHARDQSDDCIIETTSPWLIPNSYVKARPPNASRSTASSTISRTKAELQKFTTDVTDRFGPIPQQVTELMEAIRLRWLGPADGAGEDGAQERHAHRHLHRRPEAPLLRERRVQRRAACRAGATAPLQGVGERGTLRISVQDVKNIQVAKAAMESVVGGGVMGDSDASILLHDAEHFILFLVRHAKGSAPCASTWPFRP